MINSDPDVNAMVMTFKFSEKQEIYFNITEESTSMGIMILEGISTLSMDHV